VSVLLAARDAHLAAQARPAGAAKAAPSCQICFENYGEGVVPRILTSCGHTFCEGCLSQMLRCASIQRLQSFAT
jgi:hypothetical protein